MLPLRKGFGSRNQFEEISESNHSGLQLSYFLNEGKMPYQPQRVV